MTGLTPRSKAHPPIETRAVAHFLLQESDTTPRPGQNAASEEIHHVRVAIVHYWLLRMRGGEKVIESLCELYPQADIFTHVYDAAGVSDTIRRHKVTTSFISKLPNANKWYQKYLPLMPAALEALDLTAYDLVISSESGPAKGVIVRPDALHVCYVHSPMRYLWDQYHAYRKTAGGLERLVMPWLFHPLRMWDVTSAARVDHFISNSSAVAQRVMKFWRRDSEVIAPPVDTGRFTPAAQREDFYLHVGELVPYKRIDIAIEACNALQRKLVIIGEGPERAKLERIAGPTIEFRGKVPDAAVAQAMGACRAFLFPAEEDFGIVAVEAMSAGAPVIAFGRGGARDSVIDGKTGLYFASQTGDALIDAILRCESTRFDAIAIAAHAAEFGKDVFKAKFATRIDALIAGQR
ncbi:MAG: glycosyltransferase [Caulobacterales bacterium]